MKNKEPYYSPSGQKKEVVGGRLESMMQNISDALATPSHHPLPTFLTYGERRKTISAAKRSFELKGELLETPEGAYYDVLYNAYDLLKNRCGVTMEPFCTPQEYLDHGPSHLFLYHPALGPLYMLIEQKIRKGSCAWGSEMQLEIADFYAENLSLNGSLLVSARNILGHHSQGIIRYSQMTGKCCLKNVTVINKGINRTASQSYWKNKMTRYEAIKITLLGHSELYAEDIIFQGNHNLVIPDGERWVARQAKRGGPVHYHIEKPDWKWKYKQSEHRIDFEKS